jgi:ABC-type nitrate/sulfonate/bicarbonate transport system ATPase subunit
MNTKNLKIKVLPAKVTDEYGHVTQLFDEIDLTIDAGKVVTFLNSSKLNTTALLKSICEIDDEIKRNGERVFIPSMPSSFPWLSVKENIVFNLESVEKEKIKTVISMVGLTGYEDHYPNNNSIGFRFRISLARAIIRNPELIIVDNSITELAYNRRVELFTLLRSIAFKLKISVIYATSSVSDSVRISDKIIISHGSHFNVGKMNTILIDEEVRRDSSTTIRVLDYLDEVEISSF